MSSNNNNNTTSTNNTQRNMKSKSITLFKRKNKKVFGVPLEEAIKKSTINNGLPLILTRCVDHLERQAIKLEGIYRRSGNQKTVEDLIKIYDNGKDPNLEEYDPFVVAGLLKRYFTLLPDPITSFDLYDKFISAQMLKNKLMRPRTMKLLVDELPKSNQYVLYFIIQHLVTVAKHDAENKMGVSNLAIVFGPTLFRSRDDSPVRLLSDVAFLRGCVETFIKDYEIVFSSIIPNNERLPVSEHGEDYMQPVDANRERRERNRDNANRSIRVNGSLDGLEEETVVKKRGVSMSNMDFLREERSHLRFLLDKIAQDTEREELEQGITRSTIKRDLDRNRIRFDELDEREKLQSALEDEEEGAPTTSHESTSPSAKESDEEFQKTLSKISVDLDDPYPGISKRVELKMQRASLVLNSDVERMTMQQLLDEKSILKKELRFFDEIFKNQRGIEPEKNNKEPLRQLYNRYKDVRARISKLEKGSSSKSDRVSVPPVALMVSDETSASSVSIDDENYISPNSPLYGLKKENIQKMTDNAPPPSPGRARTMGHIAVPSDALYATMPMRDSKNLVVSKPLSGSVENPEAVGLTNNAEALRMLLQDTVFVELRKEKKQLQRQLHQFQNEFQKQHGRKVTTKSDRLPLEAEYRRYKEVKSKINQMIADAEAQCTS